MTKAVSVLALLGVLSCSSSSSTPDPGPPATFTQVYAALFPLGTKAQCNYCHDRPAKQLSNGNLDMGHEQATAYGALVAKPSMSTTCGGGKQLVVAGNPDASLLYLKLTAPPCGDRMPQGGEALSAAEVAMVKSWIAAGAPND